MNILNNNKIVFSLSTLAIVAFGVAVMPAKTNAQYYEDLSYHNPTAPMNGPSYYQPAPVYYSAPVYVQPQPQNVAMVYTGPTPAPVTPTIYSNSTNPNQTSTASTTKKVSTATTTKTDTSPTTDVKDSETPNDTSLAASAVSGDDGFMPSGIVGWIIFAILVVLTVVLVRKVYGGKEKYDALPMKHS